MRSVAPVFSRTGPPDASFGVTVSVVRVATHLRVAVRVGRGAAQAEPAAAGAGLKKSEVTKSPDPGAPSTASISFA